MAKNILEIYKEHNVMPNLQEHMLRVAAVASLICDNCTEKLNKEDIITACLLHDIGNIVQFQLSYFPEFNKPQGIEYWQGIQNEYIRKYGENKDKATLQIVQNMGVSDKIIILIKQINFSLLSNQSISDDMNSKVACYSDLRVDPNGVVSFQEHIGEGEKRYQSRKGDFPDEKRQILIECCQDIEDDIFAKCKIKATDITNEAILPIIEELKNFVI